MTLRLEGDPASGSNQDAVGARITAVAGGRTRVLQRQGGGSYQSSNDPRLHIGLGDADRVEQLEVRWPSGRLDHFRDLPAGTGYLLREGIAKPRPLPGFPAGSLTKPLAG